MLPLVDTGRIEFQKPYLRHGILPHSGYEIVCDERLLGLAIRRDTSNYYDLYLLTPNNVTNVTQGIARDNILGYLETISTR